MFAPALSPDGGSTRVSLNGHTHLLSQRGYFICWELLPEFNNSGFAEYSNHGLIAPDHLLTSSMMDGQPKPTPKATAKALIPDWMSLIAIGLRLG